MCQGVVNRAKGGTASASTELVEAHAASMAFDGNYQFMYMNDKYAQIFISSDNFLFTSLMQVHSRNGIRRKESLNG